MSKKYTLEETKELLDEIVAEVGAEYTYEYPTYIGEYGAEETAVEGVYTTQDGKPSCIVGALLGKVSPEDLKRLHEYEWRGYEPDVISATYLMDSNDIGVCLGDYFEEEVFPMINSVQIRQDLGNPWGVAVGTAYQAALDRIKSP